MLSRTTLCVLTTLLFVIPTNTAVALPRLQSEARSEAEAARETSREQTLERLEDVERIIDRAEASGRFDAYTIRQYRLRLMRWHLQTRFEMNRQSDMDMESAMESRRRMPWLHDVDPEQAWESLRRYHEDQRRQVRERLFRERGITPP